MTLMYKCTSLSLHINIIHRRLPPVIVEADGGGGEQVGVAVRLVVGEGHRDVELGLVCRYFRYCRYCVDIIDTVDIQAPGGGGGGSPRRRGPRS